MASGAQTKEQGRRHRKEGPHICAKCSREFDRKDSLARHMQIHDANRPPRKSRRKSCLPCARSKLRCLGEQPSCSSCLKRQYVCEYETAARSKRAPVAQTPQQLHPPSQSGLLSPVSGSSQRALSENGAEAKAQTNHPPQRQNDLDPFQYRAFDTSSNDILTQPDLLGYFNDTEFTPNFDWIFEASVSQPNLYNVEVEPYANLKEPLINQMGLLNGSTGSGDAELEDPRRLGKLPVPNPQDGCPPDDPWPMEWHSAPIVCTHLPKLDRRENWSGSHNFLQVTPISDWVHMGLQRVMQLPTEQSAWSSIEIESFPNKDQLDHCIDLYFAHFHPVVPVIHKPTFNPSDSLIVTLAVISIGACYTNFDNAHNFSIAVSELNRRVLIFMAEADRRFVRTENYLTAQLLQSTHGYCSGSERLFELSESGRSSLVHHARCMGIFRDEGCASDSGPPSDGLEVMWKDWIRKERLRRLGWAVYEYDSSVSYMHNSRPYLSTGEINMRLPSSSQHWDAGSPYAWAALHPWSTNYPSTPSLRPVLRSLFSGTPNAVDKISSHRHRLVVIIMLIRMMWTCKEIRGAPLSGLINDGLDEGREAILRTLDEFLEWPEQSATLLTKREMIQLVHRQQLIHIGHLFGAGDLMNWLYPFLRNKSEAESASTRMKLWAAEHPGRVRKVAYHSAQVLGLTRQYPNNLPLEPFTIFHAGVVLFCMALLLPKVSESGVGLRLDHLGTPEDAHSVKLSSWVRDGGTDVVGIYGVPDICSSIGRQQVLDQVADLLGRVSVWGISLKFVKVVLTLRNIDLDKTSS